MKTRVGIVLWHRTDKVNKQGLAPLSCRLTVRGKRAEISTNIRVAPNEWSGTRKKVLGNSAEAKRANSYLLQMQNELEDLIADLDRQGKPVTAQGLARLHKRGNTPSMTVLALFEAFLGERKTLVGTEIAPNTIRHNKVCYNRLKDFLEAHRLTELLAEEFTHNLADKVIHWLMGEKGFKRVSANKIVQRFVQVLRWGIRREHLEKNPLNLYKFKGQAPGKIKFLSVGELATLSTIELEDNGLGLARDCFVFQCWTGLAYADLAALNMKRDAQYYTDKEGIMRRVLRITRAKSAIGRGYECVIPLLSETERLLAHYEDALPVFTNQAYNRLLKELGVLCSIDAEKMTTHTGRRTAGTLFFNMGIPLPVVSKILGHANTLITQKLYAELLDTTVMDAFAGMFGGQAIGPSSTPYQLSL